MVLVIFFIGNSKGNVVVLPETDGTKASYHRHILRRHATIEVNIELKTIKIPDKLTLNQK